MLAEVYGYGRRTLHGLGDGITADISVTSRAARVRERALQRGRRTCAATRATRVTKTEDEAMIMDASVARMRRDGRRRSTARRSLRVTRSEGRDVETTGGARARRGVLVSLGGYARPPMMQTATGSAESSPVMDVLAGLSVASGAWRRRRPVNWRIGVYSDRSGRCRDGMVSACLWMRDCCDDPGRAGWLADMPDMERYAVAWGGVENR